MVIDISFIMEQHNCMLHINLTQELD